MNEKKSSRTIGHVEIERELGKGGMGVVHLGQQPALDRPVVIKTLRRALADDPTLEERFLREARSAAAVHHQNVVAVYDCFTWRGEHYMVQEYVEGVDLATALAVSTRVAPRIAALVALELVRGLEEIHALGIVHRDLKPSNILLSHAGATKIADFGIALGDDGPGLTQTGHAVGTPLYMSPEQLLGERADSRSDFFSLGVLMYEMLTGRVPFAEGEEEAGRSLVRRMQGGRYPRLRRLAPETPRMLASGEEVSEVEAGEAPTLGHRAAREPRARGGLRPARSLPRRDCRVDVGAGRLPTRGGWNRRGAPAGAPAPALARPPALGSGRGPLGRVRRLVAPSRARQLRDSAEADRNAARRAAGTRARGCDRAR